ncbi:Hypothetical protein KVN_LOCUS224 [uncultured virus]|nr:Hypothetical protein KVN_LOCUS224 [uncultured virus]
MNQHDFIPKFNEKESITKYLKKTEQFALKLNEEKYKLLLEFVNQLLKLSNDDKIKSLYEFKNIPEEIILKDKKNNRSILRKYSNNIIEKLKVKFDIDDETNSEEIGDKYIIYFLSRALLSIDYCLITYQLSGKIMYSIKAK